MKFPWIASALLAVATVNCSPNNEIPGGDAGEDSASPFGKDDAAVTSVCADDAASCLFGVLKNEGAGDYVIGKVNLFNTYPSGDAGFLQSVPLAKDGTFAFSSLPPWAHYYLRGTTILTTDNDIASVRGPFTVPNADSVTPDGGIAMFVEPVSVVVTENAAVGSGFPLALQTIEAILQDPGGSPVLDASVSLVSGSSSWTMPYDSANGVPAGTYVMDLPTTPVVDATATYTVNMSDPAYGDSVIPLSLIANPPSFTAALVSPATGATLPVNTAIAVQWTPQPAADYTTIELWSSTALVYVSAAPNAANVTTETIPAAAVATGGAYSLYVYATTANCPTIADGCVLASSVAIADLTLN